MGQTAIRIEPARKVSGTVAVPGDKSISHRAVLLAAFASGTTRIENVSTSADVESSIRCVEMLGAEVSRNVGYVTIRGCAGRFRKPVGTLDAGNSGTTIRLLSGLLAGQSFTSTIDGDESLRRRPMRRIIVPLERMGARIQAREEGYAPLTITGRSPLRSIEFQPETASAQVKSCILLAGLQADGITTVREVRQTRDHTERMLPSFGARIEKEGLAVRVHGPATLSSPGKVAVPGDPSSAAYLWAAAALLPDSHVTVRDVCINPTRAAILDVLRSLGAKVETENVRIWSGEPVADVTVGSAEHIRPIDIEEAQVPLLIDELPLIGVLCAYADGISALRGAQELRVKESDRISTTVTNLRRMGVEVEEKPDGWVIHGKGTLRAAELDSFGDHRIAMAFAVAALAARGVSRIHNAECVSISFPSFFEVLDGLRG